ncbi:flagellar hook protein [Photobacterium rosenbergii]|uniref:Flagellar hook protein n=1 Tax=Photobacterium rosenbergii TaxID=294936 RepID=A0ABU3ZLZ4_9GAMM|nr:flagellar hook protein [Photobacterium rosenbergii]MDV5171135.1 flagellar hook protein [Photobacterium rosenbergii]
MNIGIATLLGYAIKEIIAPVILDNVREGNQAKVESNEIQSALSESEDTLKIISSIVDVFV